ncbi:MAG: DUF3179 domain-containing protein [Anaerolineaceae bacterium]|jgi:hypothetical protein|nr:MAG: DUF3179 domain-containing protein [Anaerolineaceae bacterium]
MIWILAAGWLLSACAASQATDSASDSPVPDSPQPALTLLPAESPPRGAENEFTTDFSKHSIPYSEILSGGPPKDGIPAIDTPKFISVSEANEWLKDREPVVFVQACAEGNRSVCEVKAYPIQILMWHEIVNDTVGNEPLLVTFCPLCNTAIAFKRTFDNQVFDFGTTGRLRYSNLIMYDRQTETWWQQATGDAIAGEHTGAQLEFYPASMISWVDFKELHPDGKVLSRDTGHPRNYGKNPYFGYDDINQTPFLFNGTTPDQLPPMARVLTIDLNGEAVAYPYDVLSELNIINDTVGENDVVLFWTEGTASALDTSNIPEGREVGSAVAYARVLDGTPLDFEFKDGKILDTQTGSEWNIFGLAIGGKLKGKQLNPVVSINHFWFSWAAFKPETRVYQP